MLLGVQEADHLLETEVGSAGFVLNRVRIDFMASFVHEWLAVLRMLGREKVIELHEEESIEVRAATVDNRPEHRDSYLHGKRKKTLGKGRRWSICMSARGVGEHSYRKGGL